MSEFKGQPVVAFETAEAWRAWLDAHHADHPGLWLRIHAKGSGLPTVKYAEALDEALCYGWIDSQKAKDAEGSFLQRFGPRRARSIWSRVNREHVERLIAAGRMQPAGLAEVERAKADGRWEAAYEPASTAAPSPEFQAALDANPQAMAGWLAASKADRYAMLFRIHQAKRPETRDRRIAWAIGLLERGEKVHG